MNDVFTAADHGYMARAIQLAAKGIYSTDPNPRVGCVLVKDGHAVGEGWHQQAGQAHAEPLAIIDANGQAREATAYVTLEPCCHHGKTPPCTDALIAAGVARVVIAMQDPNPQVAGKGLARLASAGIATAQGLLAEQAAQLNPGFIKRMATGLPWVRCKLAMSLDGRTAMASGESVWITGDEARQDVQRLRARSSAVLTGSGTVLGDDPSMNVRLDATALGMSPETRVRQPLRVVLDSRLRMPASAKMLSLPGKTLIFHSEGHPSAVANLIAAGATVQSISAGAAGLDLATVFAVLGDQEINEVLIEAGPTLAGSALSAGLIDELVIYMAPHLMGDGARGLFHLPEITRMQQRVPLMIKDIRQLGADFRLTLIEKS